jgi:hypothetical protein
VRNYRGICLQSVAAKVYSNILKARLRRWAEEALLEIQYGFRHGRGCSDAIFVLRRVIDQHLVRRRPLHICFIDITKAYDSVGHGRPYFIGVHHQKLCSYLGTCTQTTDMLLEHLGLASGKLLLSRRGSSKGVLSHLCYSICTWTV